MVEEPGSNLPAPYVNPWSLLLGDLKAVIASLGLSVRELLRRNRQGSLPRPSFWPQALASLFWPLLLVLVLGLPGLTVLLRQPGPRPPSAVPEVSLTTPDNLVSAGQGAAPESSPISSDGTPARRTPASGRTGSGVEPGAVTGDGSPGPVAQGLPPERLISEPPLIPEPPAAEESSPPPASRELRLLGLLMRPEAEGLLLAVVEDPERACLSLRLSDSFRALSDARRQRLASAWLDQARALGYEQLDLLDSSGESLGRSARVGSGMILFTTAPGA